MTRDNRKPSLKRQTDEQLQRYYVHTDNQHLVSSPGRDSRDLRSSRLEEATQKPLGTNAL